MNRMAAAWHHSCCQILAYVLFPHVLGNLSVPSQNVILSSKNFSLFLTWTSTEEHPPETSYKVEIRPKQAWSQLSNCTAPSREGCDITCTIASCYTEYQARVGSILPGIPIVWNLSNVFIPFRNVELGAPQMKVDVGNESITVHLQIKLTTCKERVLKACLLKQLTYEVAFWDADEHVQRPIKQSLMKNSAEIQKSEFRGSNNCISARSVLKSFLKYSNFSEPVCFSLKQKELETAKYLAILGSALGGIFLISIAVTIVRKIIWVPSKVKMPAALDFTESMIFTHNMADIQPDVCKLSIITWCDKSEAEVYEQQIALKRNLLKETIFLDDADSTDESDEDECCGYTDSRWIPDGVICDKDETLDIQHQAFIAEAHQKANCSLVSSIGAIDLQSQAADYTDYNRLQPKSYISNPISFISDVLTNKNFSDSINSAVLDHDEQSSGGDIPLKSVKILCWNGDDDDDVDLLAD
ncbi:interferon lambda receptor 1-like [Heterodontus francisci]|uniref:interferon lambda receptor 1-like n=1 Tax=Heterodontus francisci TaxID=7792 RepID=UPI00355C4973